jgi:hypothetical protein
VHRVQKTVRDLQIAVLCRRRAATNVLVGARTTDCCRVKDTTESVKTKTYLEQDVITLEFPEFAKAAK